MPIKAFSKNLLILFELFYSSIGKAYLSLYITPRQRVHRVGITTVLY